MQESKSFKYQPLGSQDSVLDTLPLSNHGSVGGRGTHRYSLFTVCFTVQLINVVLFSGGYFLWAITSGRGAVVGLDNYFELSKYNTTKRFLGNATLVQSSPKTDEFWDHIQSSKSYPKNNIQKATNWSFTADGIVAVQTDRAEKHFSPSSPFPEDPSKSIYQVDVFHSLHCLYRIRNRLISNSSTLLLSDDHTLHCVDYLREQIMCHSDMTLQATSDYLHFSQNNGHQCRDHDAIKDWIKRHQWKGHRKFLESEFGAKFKVTEVGDIAME